MPEPDFRRRLLDGAAAAVRERGLQRTQIADIVRGARTSNRTFYECFADKEECFGTLVDKWGDEILAKVKAAVDPGDSWEHQIDLTVDAYLATLAADPALLATFVRELSTLGARGAELDRRNMDRYIDFLMELTRGPSMREAGVAPADKDTAAMVIGGFAEALDRATAEGRPPGAIGPAVKEFIKRAIAPPPSGRD